MDVTGHRLSWRQEEETSLRRDVFCTTTSPDAADDSDGDTSAGAANVRLAAVLSRPVASSESGAALSCITTCWRYCLACCKSSTLSPLRWIPSRAVEIGKCWWIRAGENTRSAFWSMRWGCTHTKSCPSASTKPTAPTCCSSRRRCPVEMCPALSPSPFDKRCNHGSIMLRRRRQRRSRWTTK